jgi:hypothetical protein
VLARARARRLPGAAPREAALDKPDAVRAAPRRAQDPVYSLDFNPATGHLATCGADKEIKARRRRRGAAPA